MALTKLNYTGQGTIPSANMPTGSVIQTVQETSVDSTITSTTATWVDVTPTATITPTSSSSKILVRHTAGGQMQAQNISASLQLLRGSTVVCTRGRQGYSGSTTWSPIPWSMEYLDSPNTTSAITYKLQIRINSTGTIRHNDTAGSGVTALASSIVILQEIAG
tara:strand:- start:72 stop:560 length:489 start_codon:yes stop_codon:yes gene_type:complete